MLRPTAALASLIVTVAAVAAARTAPAAPPFVPGTGEFLADCCDDFEDPYWTFKYNHPKSSSEQDEKQRSPGGVSNNGLWHEGALRGTPDLVQRVPTPPGGIEGSTGALMIATKNSGIPGRPSRTQQQDDLLMLFDRRLGRKIPISWQPSCTVRVYLSPFEQWEKRSGPSFGMRADCIGRGPGKPNEPYWPGMFILFRSETARNVDQNSAKLTVRAGQRGNDVRSHDITEPGWWTLGMSFTADGQIHYYASPGVEDLTSDDYLMSSFPYGFRCTTFNNFFFNVANGDNGHTWSTTWILDDPKIFVIPPQGQTVAQLYRAKAQPRAARGQATRSPQNNNQPRTSASSPTQRAQR